MRPGDRVQTSRQSPLYQVAAEMRTSAPLAAIALLLELPAASRAFPVATLPPSTRDLATRCAEPAWLKERWLCFGRGRSARNTANFLSASSLGPGPGADALAAIERKGTLVVSGGQRCYRVTASDVAAAGGFELVSVRAALTLLAAAVGGWMDVTHDGQIVFVLPETSRQILRARRSRMDHVRARTGAVASTMTKAVFGLLLLASFALVRPLVNSTLRADAHEQGSARLPRVSIRNELACLRASVRNSSAGADSNAPSTDTSVIMACFSFLFGAAESKDRLHDEQMAGIAAAIRKNNGAIVVEQVLPFLIEAVPAPTSAADDPAQVERTMLPILARFEGQPRVLPGGDLGYTFPDLLETTARGTPALVAGLQRLIKRVGGPGVDDYLVEKPRPFMPPAHRQQLQRVLLLVAVNWMGLLMAGTALGPLQLSLRLAGSVHLLPAINLIYGLLLSIGLSFILIPACRWVTLAIGNNARDCRNELRRRHAQALLHPPAELAHKLKAVRGLGSLPKAISPDNVWYTTGRTLLEQSATHDPVWDAVLRRSAAQK